MRRVLIFTSIERAFYSSVIEYQLLEPVIEVVKRSKNKYGSEGVAGISVRNLPAQAPRQFVYLGLVPITFWFSREEPKRSFTLYRRNRKKIKKLLVKNGIPCSFIPLIFPIRHKDFYLRMPWLYLYIINALPLLLYFILRHRINLIHSRNYPATLLAFFARSLLGTPYNFDMRDLYPEKGVEAGVFGKFRSQKGWSYKLWKFIERKLVQSASWVITTSEPFKKYINSTLNPQPSTLKIIPNCVNTERFKPNGKRRKELRIKYGLSDKFVLLHSGAFGTQPDLPLTAKYFLKWKGLINEVHLVILSGTRKYLPRIRKTLKDVGVKLEDYTLINPEPWEVPEFLLLGDVGLHLESMAIATPYCIAVKDGEYLSSGLPIIVTQWLRAIAELVLKYDAGIIVDPTHEENTHEKTLLKRYDEMQKNALRLAREQLAVENCVARFLELYS